MDGGPRGANDPDRFQIRRRLGTGGMGVVYEAFDSHRQRIVAIKTLRRVDPRALYHFKREFRSLVDISHPNLITLYELLVVGKDWLLTMEFVDGVNLIEYARPRSVGSSSSEATTEHGWEPIVGPVAQYAAQSVPSPSPPLDLTRLRSSLRQLAQGVSHLHSAGRLHRDVKPANVLVSTASGRVVLCDFGLVAEFTAGEAYLSESQHLAGTFPYMSPEQAAGGPLTEATDWYSVGVVLYETLTGDVPFADQRGSMMRLKQTSDPPAPSTIAARVPDDLDALCAELLRTRPEDRPSGAAVLARLGSEQRPAELGVGGSAATGFVGREQELAAMRAAFDDVARGSSVSVYVSGRSGLGKTSLVRHFLTQLAANRDTLIFSGRCYEREALPYNAFDSLMDALGAHLSRLPTRVVQGLLPEHASDLARLFPALNRVDAIVPPVFGSGGIRDPHELQRQAFGAFRSLLNNLGKTQYIVLFIDDLQWGDVDSGSLLAELLRPPSPPPVLLITTYRTDDRNSVLMLNDLLEKRTDRREDARHLRIGALTESEANPLARQLLGTAAPDALVTRLARECHGDPQLLHELVRYSTSSANAPAHTDDGELTVAAMMRHRIDNLPTDAAEALAVIAVAGRPASLELIEAASRLGGDISASLASLRVEKLIRFGRTSSGDVFEPQHDRVRATVLGTLSGAQQREYHRRIAKALESMGSTSDLDVLVDHWAAADDSERAAQIAARAAEQAARGLAFERAANLYRIALEYAESRERERELLLRFAEAAANSGRGAEAARAYLTVAEQLSSPEALEYQRLAAFELLRSGHFDDGMSLLNEVLRSVGLRLADTPLRSLASIIGLRLRLRLRGLRYRRRDEAELTAEQLTLIDVCWTAAVGLGMIDNVRAAEFQTRQLLLALKAGEPRRLARALTMEVAFVASTGQRGQARAETVQRLASVVVHELDGPEQHTLLEAATALKEYLSGSFLAARNSAAITLQRAHGSFAGGAWVIMSCELGLLWSLYYLGEAETLIERVHLLKREATRRGDLYVAHALRTGIPGMVPLLEDRPEDVEDQVRWARKHWTRQAFHIAHYWEMTTLVNRDLYIGDRERAHQRVLEAWPKLKRTQLLRIQIVRIEALAIRAFTAIAASATAPNAASLLARAARDSKRIRREHKSWPLGHALAIDAGVARARGRHSGAAALYGKAASAHAQANMALYASAARHRQAQCLSADPARDALDDIATAGCANPDRIADLLVPSSALRG